MAFKKAPAALCRQLINLGEFQPRSFATKAKVDPTKKVSAAFKGGGQPSKSSAKETKGEQSADKRFQMMLKVKSSLRKKLRAMTMLIGVADPMTRLVSANRARCVLQHAHSSCIKGRCMNMCILQVLAPAEIIPKQHTPEEQAEASRRFKDYSRKKMAQHRAWQKDLSRKYELVQIALAALPLGLRVRRAAASASLLRLFSLERSCYDVRIASIWSLQTRHLAAIMQEAALVPDNTPFPLNRQIATHTPPVKVWLAM